MPRFKRLSSAEVIAILEQFGFQIYSQRGSHIKLRRISEIGKETLTVPNHRQLDTGTCRAIYRQERSDTAKIPGIFRNAGYLILGELEISVNCHVNLSCKPVTWFFNKGAIYSCLTFSDRRHLI
jgi:predicted RNA binding protein YcfA (HicA-like mRNA interferase family)